MTFARAKNFSARTLFGAALVWFVSVTLCSLRVVPAEPPHTHPAASDPAATAHANHAHGGHAHSAQSTGDHEHAPAKDDDCSCAPFKSCPAKVAHTARLVAPVSAVLFTLVAVAEAAPAAAPSALCVQDTGPPQVESFAEHFLQRCLLSQAPPVLA